MDEHARALATKIVRLPVRTRLTLDASGQTELSSHVFCPRRGGSIDAELCAGCTHRLADSPQLDEAVVTCRVPREPSLPDGPCVSRCTACTEAQQLPVGAVLQRHVHCLAPDATLAVLRRIGGTIDDDVAVVDGRGRLVGVVSQIAWQRLPPALRGALAREVMDPAPFVVDEHESLAMTVAIMAKRRARRVFVVARDRTFLGAVRDIDALRWYAGKSPAHAERAT